MMILEDESQDLDQHRQMVASSEFRIEADEYEGNQDIREVVCREGVCHIDERAFKRCSSLEVLSLPSTLETVGKNAFSLCTSLRYVSIPDVQVHERHARLKHIGYGAFFGCLSLYDISIPSSVETIEDCTFNDCKSLAELDLQDGLVTIGERAFEGCRGLQQVHIPATVEAIKIRAFKGCISLTELTLQEGLKEIGDRVLEDCKSLERIKIPSTVSILHYSVFGQCSSLVDVTLQDGLQTIGSCAFKSCTSLRRIKIPSTVGVVGYSCFARCTSLRDVQMSSRLTFLGDLAFASCRALWAIHLPRSLGTIGAKAFKGCSNLITVEFEAGINSKIGQFVFEDCSSLTNISISPAMAFSFRDNGCFDGCENLHEIYGEEDEIAKATVDRFAQHPIHEKCYHASVTTTNELQEAITLRCNGDGHVQKDDYFEDAFGMTPFHLLLSSPTRRMDLLQVLLLDNFPTYILGRKDVFGMRATDYLLGSYWSEDTKSLMTLALKAWTMDRLELWGHEAWLEETSQQLDELLNEQNHQGRRETLVGNMCAAMERYERFEAASLLELWLWKMMMESTLPHHTESDLSHRPFYRIQCGASFIVPVVLGWLDKIAEEE
ncbi:unnamed protein product [Cylindrotheca closterium]|uniref:Uncharacterized protein n=1 Tax=Cylindrotheca closterium TaxID=2856 RepID=A0AAD2FQ38_9STRA|nr:unnamed protein product [Cylindrotheca closterium]